MVRNEDEHYWNHAISYKRAPNSWNTTQHPGCQLSGYILVDEAPGKFVIHAQSYGHDFAAHMTNLSHIVHHFSFGHQESQQYVESGWTKSPPGFAKSLHPFDDNVCVTTEFHEAYHHHLRVIATELGESARKKWTHGGIRKVYRILHNSQLSMYRQHIVPEAKFSYDFSPIGISYAEEQRSWYDYITGLLAIVGGAFTVIGMIDSGMASLFPKKQISFYYR